MSEVNREFSTLSLRSLQCVLLLFCLLSPALLTTAQTVERRGGADQLNGEITEVDDAGITLESSLGARHFVPWDRVRAVDASDADLAKIQPYLDTATTLWRARSRVERNDVALAEPLLAELFEQYHGQTHETALVVAEGLLRCRLARGAQPQAVIPMLEVVRLTNAEVSTVSYSQLPDVIDAKSRLCYHLPPYWLNSPLLRPLHRDLLDYDAQGDDTVAEIADLYAQSIAQQIEIETDDDSSDTIDKDESPSFLTNIVECTSADATERRGARDRLQNIVKDGSPNELAWARFFLGLSYLKESGIGRQERGLVNVLYLPAFHSEQHPYLAGIAMRLAADALAANDRSAEAASIRNELNNRYPYHPVHAIDGQLITIDISTLQPESPAD